MTPADAEGLSVELDVFSGRPNPRWRLTAAEADEFSALLAQLEPGPAPRDDPGLGYRGLLVYAAAGDAPTSVGNGVVRDGRTGRVLADPDRRLERWLLDRARDVEPGLVSEIAAGLGDAG